MASRLLKNHTKAVMNVTGLQPNSNHRVRLPGAGGQGSGRAQPLLPRRRPKGPEGAQGGRVGRLRPPWAPSAIFGHSLECADSSPLWYGFSTLTSASEEKSQSGDESPHSQTAATTASPCFAVIYRIPRRFYKICLPSSTATVTLILILLNRAQAIPALLPATAHPGCHSPYWRTIRWPLLL